MAGNYRLHRRKVEVVPILVRIPPSLKHSLEREARQREMSLNTLVTLKLALDQGERDTWIGPEPDDFEADDPRGEIAIWER